MVEAAASPREAVLAYAEVNLELVAGGEHEIAAALSAIAPQPVVASRSAEMHREMLQPLARTLGQLGVDDPGRAAELVNAVVLAASRQVESGETVGTVMSRVEAVLALSAPT